MTTSTTATRLTLSVAAWMTVTANHAFWSLLWRVHAHDAALVLLSASLFLAITALAFGVMRLLGPGVLLKPVISLMLLLAAVVSWFMDTYGVAIDPDMLRNALQTDMREAGDFLGLSLGWRVSWMAAVPMILVWRAHIAPPATHWRGAGGYVLASLAGFTGAFVVGMPLYKQYASFFRNHQEARSLIAPCNLLDAAFILAKRTLRARQPYMHIGLDAKQVDDHNDKPLLIVVVVGETARAANFSLGGYPRQTNPRLSRRNVFYFRDVTSCGTATAISVPCMFSEQGRDEFDVGRGTRRDNVLDVLQRAGINVTWIDNQGGCKGVCLRIAHEFAADSLHFRCDEETCSDELLLKVLDAELPQVGRDAVLVLHQMGSHGPAYFLRSPAAFKVFQPECATENIEQCTIPQIVNAYDNSIVYTDFILDSIIARLAAISGRVDSVLVYVSDHGESLGEDGLYLHGQMYMIAPDVQKRVPMLLWFSDQADDRLGLDTQCLRDRLSKPYSHDFLSHTLIGLAGATTAVYRPRLDMLSACRHAL